MEISVECQTNKCSHSPSAFFIHHSNSFLHQFPRWKVKNVTTLNNTRNIVSLHLTVRRKPDNEIQQVVKLITLQAWKFLSHKQRHYEDSKTYAARSPAKIVPSPGFHTDSLDSWLQPQWVLWTRTLFENSVVTSWQKAICAKYQQTP